MSKLVLSDLASLVNQTSAINTINNNSALIETAVENTLSRDGTSPNAMGANLDMNSNRIINLPAPGTAGEPLRFGDAVTITETTLSLPASSTDHALVRWSGTEALAVIDSPALLTTAGALSGLTTLSLSGAITASTYTAGSILFAGTAGLISQDNTKLFWDDSNNSLCLGTATAVAGYSLRVVGGMRHSNKAFFSDTSSIDDYASVRIDRTASHTGGTSSFINSGLRINTTVSAANTNWEWGLLSVLDSSATLGTENVAFYAQGNGFSTGKIWAAVAAGINITSDGDVIGLEVSSGRKTTGTGIGVGIDVAETGGVAGSTMDIAIMVPAGFPALSNRDDQSGRTGTTFLQFQDTSGLIYAKGSLAVGSLASIDATARLTVSNNAVAPDAPQSGTIAHFVGINSTGPRLEIDGHGASGSITFRRNQAGPTAFTVLSSGQTLGTITFFGSGATDYSTTSRATITVSAAETWSDTVQGTTMTFATTPIGTVTPFTVLTLGDTGFVQIAGSLGRGAPVTKTADFTLATNENYIINNRAATNTVTLPSAASWTGREVTMKTIQAQTVVSASSNVVPSTSATAGTAILPATDGAWAKLVSDGTNWIIMEANPLV